MARPALLLNVDGVLNPYDTVKCPAGFTEYDLFPGEEPVRLCPAHGEWISELGSTISTPQRPGHGGKTAASPPSSSRSHPPSP